MNERENPILDLIIALILLSAFFNISLPTVLLLTAKATQRVSQVFGKIGIECENAAYKINKSRALA